MRDDVRLSLEEMGFRSNEFGAFVLSYEAVELHVLGHAFYRRLEVHCFHEGSRSPARSSTYLPQEAAPDTVRETILGILSHIPSASAADLGSSVCETDPLASHPASDDRPSIRSEPPSPDIVAARYTDFIRPRLVQTGLFFTFSQDVDPQDMDRAVLDAFADHRWHRLRRVRSRWFHLFGCDEADRIHLVIDSEIPPPTPELLFRRLSLVNGYIEMTYRDIRPPPEFLQWSGSAPGFLSLEPRYRYEAGAFVEYGAPDQAGTQRLADRRYGGVWLIVERRCWCEPSPGEVERCGGEILRPPVQLSLDFHAEN